MRWLAIRFLLLSRMRDSSVVAMRMDSRRMLAIQAAASWIFSMLGIHEASMISALSRSLAIWPRPNRPTITSMAAKTPKLRLARRPIRIFLNDILVLLRRLASVPGPVFGPDLSGKGRAVYQSAIKVVIRVSLTVHRGGDLC